MRAVFTVLFLCLALSLGMLAFISAHVMIDLRALDELDQTTPSIVLDEYGNEWARFEVDRRTPVALADVPKSIIDAFISAEDRNFFSHYGISLKGILRSIAINVYTGRRVQGASTITQQLVKLKFLDAQKFFTRKIKEQVYAILLELHVSKEQILQAYLNTIYFGAGIYGVQAASARFWNKDISQISVAQAATLAAIVKHPSAYCPLIAPRSCRERRDLILSVMKELSYIDQETYDQAIAESLDIVPSEKSEFAVYVREMVRQFIEKKFGKRILYTGGLRIATTLNQEIQACAQQEFKKQIEHLRAHFIDTANGALISLDAKTGGIRALIGGYSFCESQLNRATNASRQVGSLFKPLVYAAGIQSGLRFCDVFLDQPLAIVRDGTVWHPRNDNRQHAGSMTLAHALSTSNNIIAIKTLQYAGVERIIDLAQRSRLADDIKPYPSLALGAVDSTLRKVVGMFNVFANHGTYTEPYLVRWVKDAWGNSLYAHHKQSEQIISSAIADQVASVMMISLDRARKKLEGSWIDSEAIGKTGTTNDSRNCWFVGATSELTTGIFIGVDDNRSIGNDVYAVRAAFPIWLGIYKLIDRKPKKFSFDTQLHAITINKITGKPVRVSNNQAITILV